MKLLLVFMARLNLEFRKNMWSPKLENDTNLVENVQRHGSKIIPGLTDKSYKERLKIMKLPSLFC
jgi:hypothetical protein